MSNSNNAKIFRYRGDTYSESFVLNVNKQPLDLSLISEVKLTYRRSTGLIEITGTQDNDTTSGRVTFPFGADDVDEWGVFPYDIQVINTDGVITTFVKDFIEFAQDVSTP